MASESPRTWTASVSTVETAQGTHSFRIARYSLHKMASVDRCYTSDAFTVGGHSWRICYWPDGQDELNLARSDSVFLELTGDHDQLREVKATYEFRMVNPVTGLSSSRKSSWPHVFCSKSPTHGFAQFVKTNEKYRYLQDDCLVIECDVMVIGKELQVKQGATTSVTVTTSDDSDIQIPPSDLSHDLRRLLESEEDADVTFKVKEETFRAHKIVLAARSPVLKALLCGPMRDKEIESITLKGIDPVVFKALLHFIYTDTFPLMDDLVAADDDDDEEEHQDMVKHLLVAADIYGMERLKSICEGILCRSLDAECVAYALALAGKHHCSKLKSACIEFIVSYNLMDVVLASQGYEHLKRACPDVAVELWENSAKSRVTRSSGGSTSESELLN